MLLKSTNRNEKIVLGLLSLIHLADDEMTRPMELLKMYQDNENYEIYLFRDQDSQNFVGLLAAEHRFDQVDASQEDLEMNGGANEKSARQEVKETIIINHLSVIPSFEDEGVELKMYKELRLLYPNANIMGSLRYHTHDLVSGLATAYDESQEN